MTKEEKIIELYKALWLSADFEIDFEYAWPTPYENLKEGSFAERPEHLIDACYQFLRRWQAGAG